MKELRYQIKNEDDSYKIYDTKEDKYVGITWDKEQAVRWVNRINERELRIENSAYSMQPQHVRIFKQNGAK